LQNFVGAIGDGFDKVGRCATIGDEDVETFGLPVAFQVADLVTGGAAEQA
jgi:hypothetical protein